MSFYKSQSLVGPKAQFKVAKEEWISLTLQAQVSRKANHFLSNGPFLNQKDIKKETGKKKLINQILLRHGQHPLPRLLRINLETERTDMTVVPSTVTGHERGIFPSDPIRFGYFAGVWSIMLRKIIQNLKMRQKRWPECPFRISQRTVWQACSKVI